MEFKVYIGWNKFRWSYFQFWKIIYAVRGDGYNPYYRLYASTFGYCKWTFYRIRASIHWVNPGLELGLPKISYKMEKTDEHEWSLVYISKSQGTESSEHLCWAPMWSIGLSDRLFSVSSSVNYFCFVKMSG